MVKLFFIFLVWLGFYSKSFFIRIFFFFQTLRSKRKFFQILLNFVEKKWVLAGNSKKNFLLLFQLQFYWSLLGISLGLLLYSWNFSFWAMVGAMVLCFFEPWIELNQKIRKRKEIIFSHLPYYLDLLVLLLEAGQDLTSAIQEIVENDPPNPLREDFYSTLQSLKMGTNRTQAFKQLAEKSEIPALRWLASAVQQSEEVGAGIAQTLRLQAEQLRQEAYLALEIQAQKIPVKMLLPLSFFIFPVIFFLLLGPIVLRLIYLH